MVRKDAVPRFNPGILFCTQDKIDQMFRMNQHKFQFYVVPGVYLFHMDTDSEADQDLKGEIGEKGIEPEGGFATDSMTRPHVGRKLCDLTDEDGIWAEQDPLLLTALGYMRQKQFEMSWTRYFTSTPPKPADNTVKTKLFNLTYDNEAEARGETATLSQEIEPEAWRAKGCLGR